jgi:SAM-dependent methyltransferase
MSERLEETLRRLQREREEADRRYNDALTALDQANPPPFEVPRPARCFDDHRLAALNTAVQAGATGGSGIKGRLARFLRRMAAPWRQQQFVFNTLLVDHLNRSTAAARESQGAAEEAASALQARFAALAAFNTRLLVYLQQITAYVDTKDRDTAGGALVLNASISGMADNLDKRWESLNARFETRSAALAATHETLRTTVGIAQQASVSLKRELERLLASTPATAGAVGRPDPGVSTSQAFPSLDSYKYVGFEDRFRGSRDDIRRRLESYVPLFRGMNDVVDVGCGRGEFLELLKAAGINAHGIDLNHEMAELCRARGLDVREADVVTHLASLPDESLGGVFAAQVVEHLQPAYLLRFLELAVLKLRPDGVLVLETLNPACWAAFFDSYIRDITHVWPLHPDTLKHLVLASGFTRAEIEYRSPVPEQSKLQGLPEAAGSVPPELVDAFNENVRKLNARMFTYLDYAVVGRR